jgi:hypothetical protein
MHLPTASPTKRVVRDGCIEVRQRLSVRDTHETVVSEASSMVMEQVAAPVSAQREDGERECLCQSSPDGR